MSSNDMFLGLTIAISLFILLAGAIIAFAILYSRRVRQHQETLRETDRKQQLGLLNAAIAAQETERERIGADIHDDIGPMLATTKLSLSKFLYLDTREELEAHVGKVGKHLDEVIGHVRRVSRNLVPQVLLEFGLEEGLETLASSIRESGDMDVHLQFNAERIALTPVQELALYRIVQEFCNNTIKHSGAKNIWIDFREAGQLLTVTLSDDGSGFSEVSDHAGLGLNNIEARSKSIGAELQWQKHEPAGAQLVLKLKPER